MQSQFQNFASSRFSSVSKFLSHLPFTSEIKLGICSTPWLFHLQTRFVVLVPTLLYPPPFNIQIVSKFFQFVPLQQFIIVSRRSSSSVISSCQSFKILFSFLWLKIVCHWFPELFPKTLTWPNVQLKWRYVKKITWFFFAQLYLLHFNYTYSNILADMQISGIPQDKHFKKMCACLLSIQRNIVCILLPKILVTMFHFKDYGLPSALLL